MSFLLDLPVETLGTEFLTSFSTMLCLFFHKKIKFNVLAVPEITPQLISNPGHTGVAVLSQEVERNDGADFVIDVEDWAEDFPESHRAGQSGAEQGQN